MMGARRSSGDRRRWGAGPTILGALAALLVACGRDGARDGEEFVVALEVGNEAFIDPAVGNWRLDQAVALGARWVRVNVPWALVEQEKGVLTWTGASPHPFDVDHLMAGIRSRGLGAVAIVQYTPTWARSGAFDDVYSPPADPADYGRFAGEVVRRYRDVVRVIEVWNEVDVDDTVQPPWDVPEGWTPFWHGTVPQYVGILNAAYGAVKAAAPEVMVLSSGLSPLEPDSLNPWLDAFFANEPRPRFDWFGWHPYGVVPEAGPDANDGSTSSFRGFERVAERLDREGYADAPIFLSEFGYRQDVPDTSMSNWVEEVVASMLPEAFAVARSSPRVRGLVWFSLQYLGWDGDYGLFTPAREARPSARAFRSFAALAEGYRFVGRESGTDGGAEPQVYRFARGDGKRLWMVYAPFIPPWFTVVEPQSVTIHASPGAVVTIFDRDGAASQAPADDAGNVAIPATHRVTYVVEA